MNNTKMLVPKKRSKGITSKLFVGKPSKKKSHMPKPEMVSGNMVVMNGNMMVKKTMMGSSGMMVDAAEGNMMVDGTMPVILDNGMKDGMMMKSPVQGRAAFNMPAKSVVPMKKKDSMPGDDSYGYDDETVMDDVPEEEINGERKDDERKNRQRK